MKRLLVFLICAAMLGMTLALSSRAAGAETALPTDAAGDILDSIISWRADAGDIPYISEFEESGAYEEALNQTLPALLGRVSYRLGGYKITGKTAVVDVAVTAPDIRPVARRLLKEAAIYSAVSSVYNLPVDMKDYIGGRVSALLDSGEIYTICTNASMYFVMGGDGRWKLDASNARNLAFIDALSGGLLELSKLRDKAGFISAPPQ